MMKSKTAKNLIEKYTIVDFDKVEIVLKKTAIICIEAAEKEMILKSISAFCAVNCPNGCSFVASESIGCEAKGRFIKMFSK